LANEILSSFDHVESLPTSKGNNNLLQKRHLARRKEPVAASLLKAEIGRGFYLGFNRNESKNRN
jgi:hypothetical protein